jgi:hypothetical protein
MQPSLKTIKRLCTLSGNRCAFDGCPVPLVEEETEVITGGICHIKSRRKGGPRYDPNQSQEDRHDFSNLILLCSRHHTIVDADVANYTVAYLQEMKAKHNPTASKEVQPIDGARAELLLKRYAVHVNGSLTVESIRAETVTFNGPKNSRPKIILPPDVVGGSAAHRRYMSHLVRRYQDFAGKQPGRTFGYGAVHRAIEREFGTSWEWVALSRFAEFSMFMHKKIDTTALGRINRSKGSDNYSSFEQYCEKYKAKS